MLRLARASACLRCDRPYQTVWHQLQGGRASQAWYASEPDKKVTLKAAMRRFYKKVHPDLFHHYADAKIRNEKSMQQLQELLLIPAAGTDHSRSGRLLQQSLMATVAKDIPLTFFVHDREDGKEAEGKAGVDLREISEKFLAGNLPEHVVRSTHKQHVREVQTAMIHELQRTLESLFSQVGMKEAFDLPRQADFDQSQFSASTGGEDVGASMYSKETWEKVRKISLPAFLRTVHPEAVKRAGLRSDAERRVGMQRAILRLQRSIFVHFVIQEQFMQEKPMPPYGAYADDPTGQEEKTAEGKMSFRASTDVYGNRMVAEQVRTIERFTAQVAHLPEEVRDCIVCFRDTCEGRPRPLVDVSGRIHLRIGGSDEEWREELEQVNVLEVQRNRQRMKEVAARERQAARAMGVKLICAATPELGASAAFTALLGKIQDVRQWRHQTAVGEEAEDTRELLANLPVLVCADGLPQALTASPLVGLTVPLSATVEQIEELVRERAGWCGRQQLFMESTRDRDDQLIMEMKRRLLLRGLRRDDALVSSKQMLDCCIRLRSLTDRNMVDVSSLSLVIADRYRVMDDGTVVLPWNFSG